MLRSFIIFSLFLHSCVAAPKTPATVAAVPAKKWLTLNGQEPGVVARGGFSGLFPESSASANAFAISTSSPGLTMLCNLQMTKDGVGICLPDIRLDNSTTISTLFPKAQKTYKVNGQDLKGWFALDYSADTIFSNVSLVQNIFSRPSIFDGQMPISAVEDVLGTKPPKFCAAEYLKTLRFRGITFISSPEIAFLKSIGMDAGMSKTKLIFEFKDPEAIEPTTNKKYSELLLDLAAIKAFASGVLVPNDYIWPLDSANYLKPASTFVADAHKAGLEVYASGFANDLRTSFNYSYDPCAEYLQFVDNGQFSVDGFITDFPPTASQAITSKKGLGIVDTVQSAITKSTLDKQLTQKVLIQSDDSSVLSSFAAVPPYTRVLTIDKEIGDAPKPSIDEIKKHAEAVNLKRSSLVTTSESFATGKTNVVEEMHKGNVSVYVSVLRNEYLSIAFDYFSDPTVEIATFIAGNGVDGVVTEFPVTATRYLRSPCSDLNKEQPYAILPAEAGALLSVAAKEAQPPASAPNPPLDARDVIDPPLPPIANIVSANASGEPPGHSGTIAATANLGLSLLTILVLGLLFAAE
ncbi:hypothetical protein F2Q69_00001052 [Brassica cretica]|uniref:glycerophosphodiester phosphodiesterase n=1 Tax=Brassica cretica TaxID=69181 RepID=A0A8S9NTN8_BRACR|nr:hypothetical protein F2Q69_00001052 [Brassica cretica]